MSSAEPTNISADAGNEQALADPNSPEAIARRAKEAEMQSKADKQYDAAAASDSFTDFIIVWEKSDKQKSKETFAGIFLACSILLFLYKAAPESF